MKKICIIDKLGLCYDGNTLTKQGLGGSESAVIYISTELAKIGFDVTVFNNCVDSTHSAPGVYNNVRYIDNKEAASHVEQYDIVIVSRTAIPFIDNSYPFLHSAKKRILWLHDTFIEGDQFVEDLVIAKKIDHIFTLSDWHTTYILNAAHGRKRNYEVLKKSIFQTRNGAVCHIDEVDVTQKDKTHFVYNASATKGMIPLVESIWPKVKERIPTAHLTIIGGYYRFREGAAPDEQENTVAQLAKREDLKNLGITFTGVIPQYEIAKILANAYMMIYPGAFPETFGISSLESLLYKTPLVTTRFGALEETAIDLACFHIDYAIVPNSLFPEINPETQTDKFVEAVINAYNNPYLYQQKQYYCDVVKDIAGWDTVALQWKEFFYSVLGEFLPVTDYRKVSRINEKVARVFGRTTVMPASKKFSSYAEQRRILVISPFWNAENYIERHIKSVAQQDYNNYLHVLINDASSDSSASVALNTISELPEELKKKFVIVNNTENLGAVRNQLNAIKEFGKDNDVVMLLDGDDWLVNNNSIFHYYNDLYEQGYEFTYGSMWSVCDNIPLISQEYPEKVKKNRSYREYHFNWKIPYTHLRTTLKQHFDKVNLNAFKDSAGNWMKSGADNPLFYELIEQVDPDKVYCNREIVCNYNDANPLNDYKIKSEEQNRNANLSYKRTPDVTKRILVGIPTNRYIEPETFKSIFDLDVPEGYELDFQYFYGYQIDQIRNLIAHWAKNYDYLFSVDSDIILPQDTLRKMLAADKDIISGLYIQRIPGTHTLEVYMDYNGGQINIPYDLLKDKGIVEIAGCGMGCALIKSEVFRTMEYPHFYYKSALDYAGTVSEDIFFCTKARSIGFKVWCDPSIICDHKGAYTFKVQVDPPVAKTDPVKENIEKISKEHSVPETHVAYLKNLDLQPKVIYDIGSCVLHWTKTAKNIWPDAEYILFDANADFEYLYKQANLKYNIGVITDEDNKVVKFYKNPMNVAGNSYYKENTAEYNESHAIFETGTTLDTIVSRNNFPLPDLIKIDIQGAEIDALKGATQCLANCNDVILEAQHVDYNLNAPKIAQVIEFMESIGFDLVSNMYIGPVDGDYHFKKKVQSVTFSPTPVRVMNHLEQKVFK